MKSQKFRKGSSWHTAGNFVIMTIANKISNDYKRTSGVLNVDLETFRQHLC